MIVVSLALTAALLWGLADFLGGATSRHLPVPVVLLVSQTLALVLLTPAVLAIAPEPDLPAAGLGLVAGVIGVVGLGAFYKALAVGRMSIVAPISATSTIIPLLYGYARGEQPGPLPLVGIALAVVGVILVTRQAEAGPNERAPRDQRTSIVLALVAAICFGTFFVGIDEAAEIDTAWTLLGSRIGEVAVAIVAFALFRPQRRSLAPHLPALAALGLADLAGTGCFVLASRHGLVSIVATLAALYPIVTVLLARLVLHERMRSVQTSGVALAFAGIGLVAGG